jgi:hypothetical protein
MISGAVLICYGIEIPVAHLILYTSIFVAMVIIYFLQSLIVKILNWVDAVILTPALKSETDTYFIISAFCFVPAVTFILFILPSTFQNLVDIYGEVIMPELLMVIYRGYVWNMIIVLFIWAVINSIQNTCQWVDVRCKKVVP